MVDDRRYEGEKWSRGSTKESKSIGNIGEKWSGGPTIEGKSIDNMKERNRAEGRQWSAKL